MRTVIATLALPLALASAAGAVDVVSCGQTIPPGAVGRLRRDLDCRAEPRWPFAARGVRLEGRAALELNGFTIRGDGTGVGVECARGGGSRPVCTVDGPGVVTGFWAGFNGAGCLFVVRGVSVHGNNHGILGPLACDLRAERVNAVENAGDGIWVWRLRGSHITASQNGARGLVASRIVAHALLAAHNGMEGVRQFSVRGRFGRIVDSTVIENDVAGAGYDIAAAGRLRLRAVRCRRSARLRYPPMVDSSDDVPTIIGSFGCIDDLRRASDFLDPRR
jgi:hypothetical protein